MFYNKKYKILPCLFSNWQSIASNVYFKTNKKRKTNGRFCTAFYLF